MKDIFELMKLEPIDTTFLDSVITHKLPSKSEVDALINNQTVIELTADEIIQQVFTRR